MLEGIDTIYDIAKSFWPKAWTNVNAVFLLRDAGLVFSCDDRGLGDFRVFVMDRDGERRCHLEAKNKENAEVTVIFNYDQYPKSVLVDMFHMARCYREYERTDKLDYAKGFDYFRNRVLTAIIGSLEVDAEDNPCDKPG